MTTVYKIRNKDTGLFSTGGTYPRWTKAGKVWKQKGHLTVHLTMIEKNVRPARYGADCEVVEYEITETEGGSVAVSSWNELAKIRRLAKEAKRAAKWEAAKKAARLKEFERLKAEIEADQAREKASMAAIAEESRKR
jgi:hypothetical protein